MARLSESEQLLDEISAFSRKLRAFFDAKVGEVGLTLSRARLLFALNRRGPLTQTDLAQELEIETPTLVKLLDGMEKQGLIERRADASDRRAKRVHMTPAGLEVYQPVQALAARLRADLMGGIPAEDILHALQTVRQMTATLQVLSGERVSS